ncbi:MAG: hypothetical protein HY064_08735 [Bacteroidetes bacterium]|nr:hypothetical protein [Bacteroidota bacterium]
MTDEQKNEIRETLTKQGFSNEQIDNAKVAFSSTTESHTIQISLPMFPKHFIRQVLITELAAVVKTSPWLGFICISSGMEFLGKCIDSNNPTGWNAECVSGPNFKNVIETLEAFKKYRPLLSRPNFNLYREFRCGLVHACAPGDNVSLSHGTDEKPTILEQTGEINFNADELYEDFKSACEEVINMNFEQPNKMNEAKIYINCTLTPSPKTTNTSSYSDKNLNNGI